MNKGDRTILNVPLVQKNEQRGQNNFQRPTCSKNEQRGQNKFLTSHLFIFFVPHRQKLLQK